MQMNKNFSNLEFRDYTHATENISEIFAYLTITKKASFPLFSDHFEKVTKWTNLHRNVTSRA